MIRDQRFLRYYDQELRFLRDVAGEFASAHARIASRFGLDADSCPDPHVEWLLDGAAFLAARVQQKLDGDYQIFTQHILGMVYPDLLAPTPACGIATIALAPNTPPTEAGFLVPRATRLQSRPVPDSGTRVSFQTAHDVLVWPIDLVGLSYLGAAELAMRRLPQLAGSRAALAITLRTCNGLPWRALALTSLPLHFCSHDHIAHRLFEAMLGHSRAVVAIPQGATDEGALLLGGRENIVRLGLSDAEAMLPPSPRGFSGHRLLREYFMLPERFLFVEMRGLEAAVQQTAGDTLELVVLLDRFDPALEGAVTETQIALFATPIINLFHRHAQPILVDPWSDEHLIVPDRLHPLDYEVWRVEAVTGLGSSGAEPLRFAPLFAAGAGNAEAPSGYWQIERRQRLLSEHEERAGAPRSAYLGSECWLNVCNADGGPLSERLNRLDIELLCTNRDLPLRLPLPRGEIHLMSDVGGPIAGARIVGALTKPRPSPATTDPADGSPWGGAAWRLVGHLSLNYHALTDGPDERGADALRSILELYGSGAEPQVARHAEAVRSVGARAVTRRLPGGGPICFGRGLEVTLDLMESLLEEGGAFVLGGVLETFFRRSVTINSFVETTLRTAERGEIMRWPMQIGTRHLL